MLNKRHNAIFYHRLRNFQENGKIRVGWIPGEINMVYLLTNTKMDDTVRHFIVEVIFHNKASKRKVAKNSNDSIGLS